MISGWNVFNFLVSPHELEKLLTPYHLVVNNGHVPMNYIESPLDEYIQIYSDFYEMVMCGNLEDRKWYHWTPIISGVSSDLSRCWYGSEHVFKGEQFKSPRFDGPVVGITAFSLYVSKDENGKPWCSTAYSYPEGFMGLQLQFPKNIQYKIDTIYEPLRTTEGLPGYKDFMALKDAIKSVTKPMTIIVDGVVKRPSARISAEAKERLKGSCRFQEEHIQIK